ncbi:hypothetical protein SAMN05443575_3875 [Jatrophihabitans endophyticus]|uniref:Uncharacterized protein n=1 Tax=Jatrophihabitans endophyticus TaxID=1206085 RepID=A0A1M5T0R2_9ACTN|nr:hypothetical protein [Jatrophihabitans endophyticus]SHH44208.1 hypothetical protein SAMN05443575_3875 [Jatrophihabitans endophyticus]
MTPLLRAPSTAVRLAGAAVLCLVPMRLTWRVDVLPGTTLYGDCNYSSGPYCVGDQYLPGSTTTTLVARSPAAVFLLVAIVALGYCAATSRTARTLTVARAGCAAAAVALVLAARQGAATTAACVAVALLAAGPPVLAATTARRLRPPRAGAATPAGTPPR